jgi:hypothetical protein
MANPFSGLENIGQSYLQGVQLAQQRQLREEALAQRQEEARIREQYYSQISADRQAALEERRRARLDAAAAQFGQDLVLNPQGEPDYAISAQKRDQRLQQEQLTGAEAELAGMYGTQPPLSPEIVQSPAFRAGMLRGTAKRLSQDKDLATAMIRRGFIPADELPTTVEDQIQGISAPDIFGGAEPMAAPAPGAPRIRMAGRDFFPPAPAAAKPKSLGYETIEMPGGGKARIELTPERAQQIKNQAAKLAAGETATDPFEDIDAAEKKLKDLRVRNVKDFNLVRKPDGKLDVVEDSPWAIARTPEQIKSDLELERKKRRDIIKESETLPGPEANIQKGTNRVPAVTPNRVIPISAIPGLPPLRSR